VGTSAIRMSGVAAFLLVVSACGMGSESAVGGDGVLDCGGGQVERSAGIDVTGDTEDDAVGLALAQWTNDGGVLGEKRSERSWYVTQDGRDVAIAYPELNGLGTWDVQDVRICADPDTGPAAVDGELDCADENSWYVSGTPDITAQGAGSAEDAMRKTLERFRERHGGEIVLVGDRVGSLVVDDREQVRVNASEMPAGGWGVLSSEGCAGFEPFGSG
jgi:hypothetical protein